jgi:DNA helicase TIP49 (TBP-interacting protein)
MSGDKEWRKILIKDPNKLVHGAVLKNGRITEGEVLMVAKNKSSSDELVRLIIMNREWMKNYEMRKALVTHPKTPLPKALRFVSELTLRDLKELARSRNVSNVIATSARKEVERKTKRGG